MNKYQMYIGRNIGEGYKHLDAVKDVKEAKFADVVATVKYVLSLENIDGFTVQHACGYWGSVKEKTVIVTVYCNHDLEAMEDLVKVMCASCCQDSILLDMNGEALFVTTL